MTQFSAGQWTNDQGTFRNCISLRNKHNRQKSGQSVYLGSGEMT